MELIREKNKATRIAFPMVDKATPETFKTGETVADAAFSSDAGAAYSSLAIAATVSEIGSTGMYELALTAAEMNHDQIIIKFTSTNAADQGVIINTDLSAIKSVTFAELPQAKPPATPNLEQSQMLLYMSLRDKLITTSSEMRIHNDAGTVIAKGALSDAAGVFTRNELESGP